MGIGVMSKLHQLKQNCQPHYGIKGKDRETEIKGDDMQTILIQLPARVQKYI